MSDSSTNELLSAVFERLDNSPDEQFYRQPRFVAHIDEQTIAALTAFYRECLSPGCAVLDLMSSWISHLPQELSFERVAGLGMNEAELAANPQLSEYLVHNLNVDPVLPFSNASFDCALIAVSIQYLTRPIEVCREIGRCLKPGGALYISMSHRCFPTKAVRGFHGATQEQRVTLVSEYLQRAEIFEDIAFLDRSPPSGDPLWLVSGRVL